ncbi:MAG: DUF2089 domain-containing protein [Lachnospiraceae bacterium]|nr:DUF2089 domain-containing protein [Lachnospiraceae bacterium]
MNKQPTANLLSTCPICQNQLHITRLSCSHCGLELANTFRANPFSYLNEEDLHFVETFLKSNGNLKELQQELHLSYPAARKRLSSIKEQLGLLVENVSPVKEIILTKLPLYQDESKALRQIKKKLNEAGGLATISLPRGQDFQIYYEEYGNGICATNLPSNRVLTWKAFDCVMEVLNQNGGKAPKGNAMKAKLGEPGLTLDTVEGYVAFHAYGAKKGDSVLRTISSLSAILEWAGVCRNGYGFLKL